MKYWLILFLALFVVISVAPFVAAGNEHAPESPLVAVYTDGEICEMPLEDYTLRVLAAYGGNVPDVESKKALAVAARSCGMYFSVYGCKHADFDACDDGDCCIALGDPSDADDASAAAVRETFGEILTLNKLPAISLFTLCASSGTRANTEFPYLTPVAEAEPCQEHKTEKTLGIEELYTLVPSAGKGGESLVVYGDNRKCEFAILGGEMISGDALAASLSLPSCEFTLEIGGSDAVILSFGAGHCYGLNLCGAGKMADNGLGYEKILEIYFPKLIKIKYF